MKKLLGLLAATGLVATTSATVTACAATGNVEITGDVKEISKLTDAVALKITLKSEKKADDKWTIESNAKKGESILKLDGDPVVDAKDAKIYSGKIKASKLPEKEVTEKITIKLGDKKVGTVDIKISAKAPAEVTGTITLDPIDGEIKAKDGKVTLTLKTSDDVELKDLKIKTDKSEQETILGALELKEGGDKKTYTAEIKLKGTELPESATTEKITVTLKDKTLDKVVDIKISAKAPAEVTGTITLDPIDGEIKAKDGKVTLTLKTSDDVELKDLKIKTDKSEQETILGALELKEGGDKKTYTAEIKLKGTELPESATTEKITVTLKDKTLDKVVDIKISAKAPAEVTGTITLDPIDGEIKAKDGKVTLTLKTSDDVELKDLKIKTDKSEQETILGALELKEGGDKKTYTAEIKLKGTELPESATTEKITVTLKDKTLDKVVDIKISAKQA